MTAVASPFVGQAHPLAPSAVMLVTFFCKTALVIYHCSIDKGKRPQGWSARSRVCRFPVMTVRLPAGVGGWLRAFLSYPLPLSA